jgi:hypothetical protein
MLKVNHQDTINLAIANAIFADDIKALAINGIVVGSQWAREFFVLQASKVFGPIIEIILNMLVDIAKFSIIYGFIFLIFLATG